MELLRGSEPPIASDILENYADLFTIVENLRQKGLQSSVGLIAVRPLTHDISRTIKYPYIRSEVQYEELLMVRRNDGTWTNPAGHVENGDETIFKAVAWEALQEAGLRTVHAIDYVVSDLLDVGLTKSGKFYLLFKAWVRNNFRPQLLDSDDDLVDVAWIDAGTISNLLTSTPQKYQQYVRHYLKGWDTPIQDRVDDFIQKTSSLLK
jgi:8-oxo-dGTP pyrophosphatase MutT (NUDIX family)